MSKQEYEGNKTDHIPPEQEAITARQASHEGVERAEQPVEIDDLIREVEALYERTAASVQENMDIIQAQIDLLRAGLTSDKQKEDFDRQLVQRYLGYAREQQNVLEAVSAEPAPVTSREPVPEDRALLLHLLGVDDQQETPQASTRAVSEPQPDTTVQREGPVEQTATSVERRHFSTDSSLLEYLLYENANDDAAEVPAAPVMDDPDFLSYLLRSSLPSAVDTQLPVFDEEQFLADLISGYETQEKIQRRMQRKAEREAKVEAFKTSIKAGVDRAVESVCRTTHEVAEAAARKRRRVAHVVSQHVSAEGLAKAGIKLALPVAGAIAPIAMRDSLQNLVGMQDQLITASISGFLAGSVLRFPIGSMIDGFDRGGGRFNWRIMRSGLANTVLAGLAALTFAQDTSAYRAISDIEASGRQIQTEATEKDNRGYLPGIELMRNPESLPEKIIKDQVPLTDIRYIHSVAVQRTRFERHLPDNLFMRAVSDEFNPNANLEAVEEVVQVPAAPINFVDRETGEVAFAYKRSVQDYLNADQITDMDRAMLNAVEELPDNEGRKIGPIEITSADEFILRLGYRNILDIFNDEDTSGGASTVDMQLAKMIFGRDGQPSMLNPDIQVQIYHPEKYGPAYAYEMYKAIRRGEILDPASIVVDPEQNSMADYNTLGVAQVNLACQQMERYIYGKLVATKPEYIEAYLNNIPFGSFDGVPVIGIGGASIAYFGVPHSEASPAMKLAIYSAIPRVSEVRRAFQMQQEGVQPEEGAFTVEDFRNVVLANVGQLDVDGVFQTPEEKLAFEAEVNALFDEGQFTVTIPHEYKNMWMNSISGDLRTTVEGVALSSLQELADNENVRVIDGEIFVDITLPEFIEPYSVEQADVGYRVELPFSEELGDLIHANTSEQSATWVDRYGREHTMKFYEGIFNGKLVRLPDYDGQMGVGVMVMDETGRELMKMDETGPFLLDQPIEIGSVMKTFVYAFSRYKGYIKGPKDMTNDYPGRYGLAQGEFDVVNASKATGRMSVREALVKSRNVPWARFLYNHVYAGTDGMSEAELNAHVEKQWAEVQDFANMYGFKLTDVAGNEITNPRMEGTELAAIGTGIFLTSNQNEIVTEPDPDNPGEDVSYLDIKESSAAALARFFLAIESPETSAIKDNPELVKISNELSDILKPLGVKGKDSFAKTGTVFRMTPITRPDGEGNMATEVVAATTGTFNAMVVREGDKVRVVILHTKGRDPYGNELNLDEAAKIAGVGNESFKFKPMAEWLAMQTLGYSAGDMLNPRDIRSAALELLTEGKTDMSYHLGRLTADTPVKNNRGDELVVLPAGSTVDVVGEPRDGLQQVSWHERFGQIDIMKTGFVDAAVLAPPSVEINGSAPEAEEYRTVVQEIMGSEVIQQHIDTDHFFTNPSNNISYVVVGRDETSPILAGFYQQLAPGHQLALSVDRSADVLEQLGVPPDSHVIVLNADRLKDYIGTVEGEPEIVDGIPVESVTHNRTPVTEAMLARELKELSESFKFEKAIESVAVDTDLQQLLGDENSPARRLINALHTGRSANYQENQVVMPLLLNYLPSHPRYQSLASARRAATDYIEIMSVYESGKPVDKEDVDDLIDALNLLNHEITQDELRLLGISQA